MSLALRAPTLDDLPHFERLFCDVSVGRKLWPGELGGPRTSDECAVLLANDVRHWAKEGFGPWLAFEDGELVGRGGLARTHVGDGSPTVEVLYAVLPEHQGAGHATAIARAAVEEARRLGLPEVVGFTWTENPASAHVLEKAGLRFERVIEHAGLPHWFGRLALGG
jgi:RimJ/RimL family protein N-acetyltransferase